MSKRYYIGPSVIEISLDATSVLLVNSQEPPKSGNETDTDEETGDDSVEPISLGRSGTERIWGRSYPF